MAKHRKRRSRKSHRRTRVTPKSAPRRRIRRRSRRAKAPIFKMARRRRGSKGRRRSFSFRRVSRRSIKRGNPPALGGWFRIPTVQELLWVGVGALGVPTVNRFLTNLIPLEAVKSGYGNIATELVIGSLASGFARKYAGSTAGDVIFTLVLARAVGRTAFNLSGGMVGFADAADEALSFYDPAGNRAAIGFVDPSVTGALSEGVDAPDSPV